MILLEECYLYNSLLQTPRQLEIILQKKNYERKRKSEKVRRERREIDIGCQSISKGEMYKKHFSFYYVQIFIINF